MKYFAVLLLVAAVSADEWTPRTLEQLRAVRQECFVRLNISAETSELYRKWNFPENDTTRSLVACLFKGLELFCDHQGFHTDRLIAQFQHVLSIDIKPNVDECVAKTDADTTNDRWVLRVYKCIGDPHFSRSESTKNH